MRRSVWIFAGVTALGVSLGCARANGGSGATVRSSVARDTSPNVETKDVAELVAGNTSFAIDVYKALAARTQRPNLVLSPYSISVAVAMTYAGAVGETAAEMAAAAHLLSPPARLHATFDLLDLALARRNASGVVLRTANSLWAGSGQAFSRPFLDTMARSYGTGVHVSDFKADPEKSRRQVNQWVAEATDNNIPELLRAGSFGETPSLILLNAAYFHATWSEPFRTDDTARGKFWGRDGQAIAAQMMSQTVHGACDQTPDYDLLELPYVGEQIALDVLMPKPGSFGAFERSLTGERVSAALSALRGSCMIRLTMPRFQMKGAPFSLTTLLEGLGVHRAFQQTQAQFTGMSPKPMFISDVLQQAMISVDESGTTATAATGVMVGVGAPAPRQVVAIDVDHPFLFFVRDVSTGTLLFAGRIADPSEGDSHS